MKISFNVKAGGTDSWRLRFEALEVILTYPRLMTTDHRRRDPRRSQKHPTSANGRNKSLETWLLHRFYKKFFMIREICTWYEIKVSPRPENAIVCASVSQKPGCNPVPGPRLIEKRGGFAGPRSHKRWESLVYVASISRSTRETNFCLCSVIPVLQQTS
jgi:hypothetical protein